MAPKVIKLEYGFDKFWTEKGFSVMLAYMDDGTIETIALFNDRAGSKTAISRKGLRYNVKDSEPSITRIYKDGTYKMVANNTPTYTNIVKDNTRLSNVSWNKSNITVVEDTVVSIFGKMNAATITVVADGGNRIRTQNTIPVIQGDVYTWSWYVKKLTANPFVKMIAWSSDDPKTTFDLDNVSIVSEVGPTHTSKITDEGEGWRRISITREANSTTAWAVGEVKDGLENDAFSWFGASVVEGTDPLPLVVTEANSVVSFADVGVTTPIITPYLNSSDFVLRIPINAFIVSASSKFAIVSDGTDQNYAGLRIFNNSLYFDRVMNGTPVFTPSSTPLDNTIENDIVVVVSETYTEYFNNGGSIFKDSTPSVYLDGTMKKFSFNRNGSFDLFLDYEGYSIYTSIAEARKELTYI